MFVVFDGIDGAGKTTQIRLTSSWLESMQYPVVTCRDPGSTELGSSLRKLLLASHAMPICPMSESLLFSAARSQLVHEVIRPALDAGSLVLCDRYILSTVVYQGHAGGLSTDELWKINSIATGHLWPALTFLFDLPVEIAEARWSAQPDRMETRGAEYFRRVREGFLLESERFASGVVTIDATATVDEVQQRIQNEIQQRLGLGRS